MLLRMNIGEGRGPGDLADRISRILVEQLSIEAEKESQKGIDAIVAVQAKVERAIFEDREQEERRAAA